MKAVRSALIVVILLNLSLLAAMGPLRATLARYDLARRQTELRRLAVENRTLQSAVAQATRPDRVAARAAAMGLDLRTIESQALAGSPPAEPKPALVGPRH